MPIRAAGAVLWRPSGNGTAGNGIAGPDDIEVAVAHRPRYDDWSIPKGKVDDGETVYAAAVRELREETGHSAHLGRHLGQVAYRVGNADKTVDYFSARENGSGFTPNDEVDSLRWLPVTAAAELLTYHQDRDVLAAFAAAPAATALLLVRHAHAGSRSAWDGPDDERPLSDRGRLQVKRLTAVLPLFGPLSLHAVPNTRCTDTLAPLGSPVTPEPALGDTGYEADPAGALARLLEIAAAGPAVVCSQGGAIPELLAGLGVESGVEGLPAKKGSAWLLGVEGDKLIGAAHYDPTP